MLGWLSTLLLLLQPQCLPLARAALGTVAVGPFLLALCMPSCVRVFALYARLILLSGTVHVGARGCVCMCVAVWSCAQGVRASRL